VIELPPHLLISTVLE